MSVFAPPETRLADLTFFYRGPEYAIAVPEGDRKALAWAMGQCSQFWNGASTLIVPVRTNGRTWMSVRDQLELRPVETCFVHESVPAPARAQLEASLGTQVRHWGDAWDGFHEEEMHPLLLQPKQADATKRRTLRVPRFDSAALSLISLASWGHIPDEHRSDYRDYFDIGDVADGPGAHAAMLVGQLNGTSPLEQSMSLINSYGSLPIGRGLFVFERGSFQELVTFWNLRSRTREAGNRPLLFAVTRAAFEQPQILEPLGRHLALDYFYEQMPDIGVMAEDRALAAGALESLGYKASESDGIARRFGHRPSEHTLSFGFFGPTPADRPWRRGALGREQVTIASGELSCQPPTPPAMPATGRHIRVGIQGLPLPMPLTDATAKAVFKGSYESPEGLTIHTTSAIGQSRLRFALPDAWAALESWAEARGETVRLSPPGRYGQALLDRLGSLDALKALADERSLAILETLAPPSRKKLVQRVVKEAKQQTGSRLDEKLLAELLARESPFIELKARSAGEIASIAEISKAELLPRLAELVETGFVIRGAAIRCPRCTIGAFLLLEEQRERVRCRHCGFEFLLPVLDSGERGELPVSYQLDGLMSRAMDQDLLPVLLTLAASIPTEPLSIQAAWLGLEFDSATGQTEHDLLISTGQEVSVAECKATASISREQLRALLRFAAEHKARPMLSALSGSFTRQQRDAIAEQGGLVFERTQLLSTAPPA